MGHSGPALVIGEIHADDAMITMLAAGVVPPVDADDARDGLLILMLAAWANDCRAGVEDARPIPVAEHYVPAVDTPAHGIALPSPRRRRRRRT